MTSDTLLLRQVNPSWVQAGRCGLFKSFDQFSTNKKAKDGLQSQCKDCWKKYREAWYADPENRKLLLEQMAIYDATHKDEKAERNAAYLRTEEGKTAKLRSNLKHPMKVQARNAAKNAVAAGKLINPGLCEWPEGCDKTEKLQKHHHLGYEEEHWLDVQWLCQKHHTAADKLMAEPEKTPDTVPPA